MSEMELYLRDLKPEAQRRVLSFLGLKSPEEGNLDVFPIATIPKPDDNVEFICSECAEERYGKKRGQLHEENVEGRGFCQGAFRKGAHVG
jgi:hypothetical protein